MYRLYARNAAGSMAVEALLALCGLPCEVILLERRPDGSYEEFIRSINPKAEVPTLVMPDGSVMTESAAILIYLADLHPEAGLSPAIGSPQRAEYLRWQVYLATTVYMSDLHYYSPQRYTTNPGDTEAIKARGAAMMMEEFAIYAGALGQGPFMLGTRMSTVDVYAAMLCTWVPDMQALFDAHPNLKSMYESVVAVPDVKKVWERNGL